jgi:acyl transferase domain-containing protein
MTNRKPLVPALARVLYPVLEGAVFDPQIILRAGAQAMGFGGINAHVTLESGDAPAPHLATALGERALLVSAQDTEVIPLAAASVAALIKEARRLQAETERISDGEVTDLAVHYAFRLPASAPVRAALVAHSPVGLARQLEELAQSLQDNPLQSGELRRGKEAGRWWASRGMRKPRIGWLLPGQGSQQVNMARVLVERYAWARRLVAAADRSAAACRIDGLSSYMYRPLDRAVNGAQKKGLA